MTNADKIRAMTDEELAGWIIKHDCHTLLYGYNPKDAVLDWLKQEVDELYDYYISRGFDDVMSFDEYMSRCKELGTKLAAGWKSGFKRFGEEVQG